VITHSLSRCQPLLGTFVEITLKGQCSNEELISTSNKLFSEIRRIHDLLGFHDEKSELSALNTCLLQQSHSEHIMSDDMQKVLRFAKTLYDFTLGFYDISVAATLVKTQFLPNLFNIEPTTELANLSALKIKGNNVLSEQPMCIDLGGIAKGYAIDCAMALLPSHVSGVVNAGGDMRISDWQHKPVIIRYAARSLGHRKVVMQNKALATSASYYKNNGSQFINPKTGENTPFKGSVSVFADTAMHADALTKAVMFLTKSDARLLLNAFKAQAYKINRFGFISKIM
jgi:thiamine biosynthesis lipoprotein